MLVSHDNFGNFSPLILDILRLSILDFGNICDFGNVLMLPKSLVVHFSDGHFSEEHFLDGQFSDVLRHATLFGGGEIW